LAKEICDRGQVTVNDRKAKAGAEVKAGDKIGIGFGNRNLKIRIVDIRENTPAKMAADLYEILEDYRPARDDEEEL
jgi:ribosomal 50S subunit-recycling heat shock protein